MPRHSLTPLPLHPGWQTIAWPKGAIPSLARRSAFARRRARWTRPATAASRTSSAAPSRWSATASASTWTWSRSRAGFRRRLRPGRVPRSACGSRHRVPRSRPRPRHGQAVPREGSRKRRAGRPARCPRANCPGILGAIFSAQVIEQLELARTTAFSRARPIATEPRRGVDRRDCQPPLGRGAEGVLGRPQAPAPPLPGDDARALRAQRLCDGDVFAPAGTGDWDEDRTRFGEYAVVAAPVRPPDGPGYAVETGLPSPSSARSASTISFTSSSKSTVGSQPAPRGPWSGRRSAGRPRQAA